MIPLLDTVFCCKSGLTACTVQHLSDLVSTTARVFNPILHGLVAFKLLLSDYPAIPEHLC